MAYKRTSRKSGNFRSTKTVNTNGTITNSSSSGIKGGPRTTTSWSSKGGMKQTQTYKDGAGYVHTRTIYKSETDAARRRKEKNAREFWAAIFGTKKKRPAKRTKKPTTQKVATKQNTSTGGAGVGWLVILCVIALAIYAAIH